MFAQLVPLAGGEPIVLNRDINVVGREQEGCDVVIDNKSVSKMHCIVVKTDGCLFVRDLASTNGTRVNGQKVVRGALLPNDILQFASEKYRVHLAAAGQAPAPAGIHGTVQLDFPSENYPRNDFDSDPLKSQNSADLFASEDVLPQPEARPSGSAELPVGKGSDMLRGKVIIPDGGINLNQIDPLEELDDPLGGT